MEENLLGHLLKANDPATQADVERLLASDADARRRLDNLRTALVPLAADDEEFEPPIDLVVRTIACVAEHVVKTEYVPNQPRSSKSVKHVPISTHAIVLPSETLPTDTARRRNWITSIGLTFAGLALLFPAVVQIRNHNRLIACQNNLRQFHQGLVDYSNIHNNQFPQVKDAEKVLTVGRVMMENGYLPPSVMNCPHTLADDNTSPVVLASYAYSLGYRDGPELRGLSRDGQNDLMPILADAPRRLGGESQPVNHRRGQNVLFVGGNVRFCPTSDVGVDGDNIFCNTKGEVAAGLTRWDSVLGRAEEHP